MILVYGLCGIIIGVVMGLTGAGGALIAIPLFIQFVGLSFQEASVLSLFAVVIASLSNFIAQREFTRYKLAAILVFFSALGSYFSSPYKNSLPNWVAVSLISAIALFALYSVWTPGKTHRVNDDSKAQSKHSILQFVIKNFSSVLIGIILGILTTFTGLGGGVLMMPILLSFYKQTQEEAVATGLLSVGLSSVASIAIQSYRSDTPGTSWDLNLLTLCCGILIAAFFLKMIMSKISTKKAQRVRQIVFTLVVAIALFKIL